MQTRDKLVKLRTTLKNKINNSLNYAFKQILDNKHRLTNWEIDFIYSIRVQFKETSKLSEKQFDKLWNIKHKAIKHIPVKQPIPDYLFSPPIITKVTQ